MHITYVNVSGPMLNLCRGIIAKFIPIDRTHVTVLLQQLNTNKEHPRQLAFTSLLKAKPIAYPRSPLPAKGIILDNNASLLIWFSLHIMLRYIRSGRMHSPSFQANYVEQRF